MESGVVELIVMAMVAVVVATVVMEAMVRLLLIPGGIAGDTEEICRRLRI